VGDHIGVRLTAKDIADCKRSAVRRMNEAARMGLNHATSVNRSAPERLHQELAGVCGELAVEYWLGRRGEAGAVNTFHHIPDVGRAEVRCAIRHTYNLIVRDWEPMQRAYILTTIELPNTEVWLHGWLWGYEAELRGRRWNPGGTREAWLVRQDRLRPLPDRPLQANMRALISAGVRRG
jgi:hypothetical protein